MATARKIRSPGGEEMILLSLDDYEDLFDAAAVAKARAEIAADPETLSHAEVEEALASPTLLAFWRRKRGVSREELAEASGTTAGYIADVEGGLRVGEVSFYERAARALRVRQDDIMPDEVTG